jgi:hypothetical protein
MWRLSFIGNCSEMTIKRSTTTTQICPICKEQQPLSAMKCAECGAALPGVPFATTPRAASNVPLPSVPPRSEWGEGEDDLFEGALPGFPLRGLAVLLVALLLIAGGLFFIWERNNGNNSNAGGSTENPTAEAFLVSPTPDNPLLVNNSSLIPTLAPAVQGTDSVLSITATALIRPRSTIPPTNTKRPSITPTEPPFVPPPTLDIPTVTPIPPSPTLTPTRGPCVQKAKPGDTLSSLMARCGVYSRDAIQTVLDMNNMKDTVSLQIGQTVEIPWPTPTGGAPVSVGSTTPGAAVANVDAEPTLPPGFAWYTVGKNDSAITIAVRFNTTIKVLNEINPEISSSFLKCDPGVPMGGQDCIVTLNPGQRIRVPVPLPTATLSPTPNGSETPTPTFTATFNAPYLISPGNNMLFEVSEFPVLRWSASDRLSGGQVYLIFLKDKTANKSYRIPTKEMFYPLTSEIQPADGKRHEFEWAVGIGLETQGLIPDATNYITETRTFVWQGR